MALLTYGAESLESTGEVEIGHPVLYCVAWSRCHHPTGLKESRAMDANMSAYERRCR
jgi:hypothetical protein